MIFRAKYSQLVEAPIWEIPIGDITKRVRPLSVYKGAASLDIVSWEIHDYTLYINFGTEIVSGELEYEFQLDNVVEIGSTFRSGYSSMQLEQLS